MVKSDSSPGQLKFQQLKICIYAVTGTEIRSLESSFTQPEIHLEEMLKEARDH